MIKYIINKIIYERPFSGSFGVKNYFSHVNLHIYIFKLVNIINFLNKFKST